MTDLGTDTVGLGNRTVKRMGFGAMQLPGKGVFGPPRDREKAKAVLRRAVELGVDHIDTAQFYGPDVANELIRETLHPYPEQLTVVSKVGARRGSNGEWMAAQTPRELREGVEANLRSLDMSQVHVVNLRRHDDTDVAFEDQLAEMVAMREEGLIGAVGLSNVSVQQLEQADEAGIACVQNAFNLSDRSSQPLLDRCARSGIAFVPFFPLGSAFAESNPVLGHPEVSRLSQEKGVTPAQIVLAWLLHLSPAIALIPGTSSLEHLEENLAAGRIHLDEDELRALEG